MNESNNRVIALQDGFAKAAVKSEKKWLADLRDNNLAEMVSRGEYERACRLVESGHDINELSMDRKHTSVIIAISRVYRAVTRDPSDLDGSINMTVFLIDEGANLDFKARARKSFWGHLENLYRGEGQDVKDALNSIFQALEERLKEQAPEVFEKYRLDQPA